MLEIQKYLINGGTLKELRQKYHIRYVPCSPLNLVSLNCQILSPTNVPMVNECRSLFLNPEDWSVAFRSVNNFFDISSDAGKLVNEKFDWVDARAYEKLDGAMICVYFYKNEWKIGSRFSPDGGWLAFGLSSKESVMSWKELTIKTIEDSGINIDDFYKSLDKNIFYSYEICTEDNQVGVVYNQNVIKLIAAFNKTTLKEIDIETIDSIIPKANYEIVNSLEEVENLTKNKEAHEMEGFVVVDKNFNRIKVYNQNYLKAMNLFSYKNANEALANLVSIFVNTATYNYNNVFGPASLDDPSEISNNDSNVEDMLTKLITLGNWMTEASEKKDESLFTFWPDAFSRLNNGESFSDIILDYDNDYILAKINQFENSYLN